MMNNCLYIFLDAAAKAKHMAEVDPHGWIITLVSVTVVFSALIILFFCYTIVGKFCTGAVKEFFAKLKKSKPESSQDEVAAAIALALNAMGGNETEAAIALALDRYLNEAVHDSESYVITIKRRKK